MTAILSDDLAYRYFLGRDLVDPGGDLIYAYIGVNPSTADHVLDDQTVKKWRGFTKVNGGRRFIVGNLFAYRARDVRELDKPIGVRALDGGFDPVGEKNDEYLRIIAHDADVIVPCWGRREKLPIRLHGRIDEVLAILRASGKPMKTFGLTAGGDPKHPLTLGYDTPFIDF